jgi:hypothetical protein
MKNGKNHKNYVQKNANQQVHVNTKIKIMIATPSS